MVLVVSHDGPFHCGQRRSQIADRLSLCLGQGQLFEGEQERGLPVAVAQDRRLSASLRARPRRQAAAFTRYEPARSGHVLRQDEVRELRTELGGLGPVNAMDTNALQGRKRSAQSAKAKAGWA